MSVFKQSKEWDLYYHVQSLISETTGFELKKIVLLEAKKVHSKKLNNFIFRYKGKVYHLLNGKLEIMV